MHGGIKLHIKRKSHYHAEVSTDEEVEFEGDNGTNDDITSTYDETCKISPDTYYIRVEKADSFGSKLHLDQFFGHIKCTPGCTFLMMTCNVHSGVHFLRSH